ncbi:hypothetical protein FQN52_002086 [Onygenales sp. PD_12]|nr:hypothetical protein FQN52_002086 [Onygenales sp. PD_12]
MPGAIALAAIFFVSVVEMLLSPGRHICSPVKAKDTAPSTPIPLIPASRTTNTAEGDADERRSGRRRSVAGDANMRRERPLNGRSTSIGRGLAQMNVDLGVLERIESSQENSEAVSKQAIEETRDSEVVSFELTPEQKHKKAVMQCMLLEMGILCHSVFIGMALSVSIGSDFIVLLIAITFHQTFEGLALGSRIASLTWDDHDLQPWFMAIAYGCTTPIGQAIGLGTHTLYDPNSEVGLIMVGTMNAVSSGLLVYASLVELLSEDFLSDESWRLLRGRRRVFACVLVFLATSAQIARDTPISSRSGISHENITFLDAFRSTASALSPSSFTRNGSKRKTRSLLCTRALYYTYVECSYTLRLASGTQHLARSLNVLYATRIQILAEEAFPPANNDPTTSGLFGPTT